ncbi:MAG: prepilin-type N-terminal cleavage/methylation domain-containing protein [Puniceicoccales bacterium]|jgi:prepilin-type N-terminal cleavage/methylation domain-containing protein|nr:prepilin-type N-terminal cleavage/methylation domain-containing protein [Puniceicoccales bacterium]
MDISKKNGRSGMTLIEILVVVALLGVLAGVLVRSLGSSSENGKRAAAQLFFKTTLKSLLMGYKVTYGHYPKDQDEIDKTKITDKDFWTNPWGQTGKDGYMIKDGASPSDPIEMWTLYDNQKAGAAAPKDPNLGCFFNLSPDGKLTDGFTGAVV